MNVVELVFEGMCNTYADYTVNKVMKEIQMLRVGFICEKWGRTTKKGTKALFRIASDEELEEKIEKLKKTLQKGV